MKKDTRDIIVVMGAALAVVTVIFSSVFVYSGVWPPFSVVESGSMQHGEESRIGVIDTGDMVVVRDKSKVDITSYVEGYKSGYSRFGEYGDVIIYQRLDSGNPIIHRAILWLEYSEGKWSAPSLEGYVDREGNALWSNEGNTDPNDMRGELTLYDIGYSSKTASIKLDTLYNISGYLTMGDNGVTNMDFDQNASFSNRTLVSEDRIKYVAGFEIPWIGSIKLYATGTNVDLIPPNSIPSMVLTGIGMICIFAALFVVIDYINWYRNRDEEPE